MQIAFEVFQEFCTSRFASRSMLKAIIDETEGVGMEFLEVDLPYPFAVSVLLDAVREFVVCFVHAYIFRIEYGTKHDWGQRLYEVIGSFDQIEAGCLADVKIHLTDLLDDSLKR